MRASVRFLATATLLAATSPLIAATAEPGAYTIDASHSSVAFAIGHVGASEMFGRFDKLSGSFTLDADLDKSKVETVVDATSVYTGLQKRDDHVRNPDFLDTAKFAVIRFVSTGVVPKADGGFTLAGKLEFMGVTRPVSFDVRTVGAGKDPWGGYRAGFVATTSIKRSDFGMSKMLGPVGDEVKIQVAIEATKNK